jgi:hypothetical protein
VTYSTDMSRAVAGMPTVVPSLLPTYAASMHIGYAGLVFVDGEATTPPVVRCRAARTASGVRLVMQKVTT